jgi:hypothetical protein
MFQPPEIGRPNFLKGYIDFPAVPRQARPDVSCEKLWSIANWTFSRHRYSHAKGLKDPRLADSRD